MLWMFVDLEYMHMRCNNTANIKIYIYPFDKIVYVMNYVISGCDRRYLLQFTI